MADKVKSWVYATALTVPCPVCFSQPGEPCTAPTDDGQRPVKWYHYKRLEAVE